MHSKESVEDRLEMGVSRAFDPLEGFIPNAQFTSRHDPASLP
jgi:hypothetical protein